VWVQTGPLAGPLGPRRTLFHRANVADVAVGPRGDLAVTVLRPRGPHRSWTTDAWLAVRRPDGAVRRALVARGAGATAAAVNASADVLVVYDLPRVTARQVVMHRFAARLLTRHGRWLRPHAIGRITSTSPGNGSEAVVAALDDARRTI
jgi:hypothetical protein